jgi:hypothetical protein
MALRTPRWKAGVVGGAVLGFVGDVLIVVGGPVGVRPGGLIAALAGILICAWSSGREQLTIDPTGVGLRGVMRVRHLDWGDVRMARLLHPGPGPGAWSVEVIDRSGRAHRVRPIGTRVAGRRSLDADDSAHAVALINGRVGCSAAR